MSDQPGSTPLVSVIVRCFNEAEHIGRLLTGIFHQSVEDLEVVVVDSGSTDGTVEIVNAFPTRLVRIEASEFSFGRSLNRGCAVARGDFLVFISAHCYPTYDDWLERITAPFEDPDVQVVYGKQRGNDMTKYSERRIFEQWFPDRSDPDQKHPFSNNANCAIRRARWVRHPYDEELTGLEDLAWSKRVLEDGGKIVYAADAEVIHVHDESPLRIYNRYRREALAFKKIMGSAAFGLRGFFALTVASVWRDLRAAYGEGVLLRNLAGIFVFRLMQYWGAYRGFAMQGPIEQALKRKLYYPQPPRDGQFERRADGREIPYWDAEELPR